MTNFAFHGDISLASKIMEQVTNHEAADEIIQGTYWENGKGCFIGCIAHGKNVDRVEQQTGFPEMLTRIAEGIFESLPNDVAKTFPRRILEAPSVGADLSLVSWKFLHWLIDDVLREHGTDDVQAACAPALEILAAKSCGKQPTAYAARAAARAAAYAADAARAAAYAADAAYAAADARAAARIRQANKLIELLKAA